MNKIFAFFIFLSLTIKVSCVEIYQKLPMFGGLTNLQNWVATNTTEISVNVWQEYEDGTTLGYYLNAIRYRPTSFTNMKEKIWETIIDTANLYIESGQYTPRFNLKTYCGTSFEEYIEFDRYFFSTQHILNKVYGTEFYVTNGIVDYSSVEKTPINFVRDIGFRFDTKAQSVTLRVDGVEIADAAYISKEESNEGGVFVRSKYLSSSSRLEISIKFRDGTTLNYDAEGNLIGDFTPRLVIQYLKDRSLLVEVTGLFPNQTVRLETSINMKDWTLYPGVLRATKPTILETDSLKFFRIAN